PHIECIEFLSDTTIICSIRDPRSNYVALLREAPHFKDEVRKYVAARKKALLRLEEKIPLAANMERSYGCGRVVVVNFERFVVEGSLRDAIAESLGLNLEDRTKYKHFRPWESFRNVILHE